MKIHFEPDLDFQLAAIESVCGLFRGQEVCRTEFTVTRQSEGGQSQLAYATSDLGVGNRLQLLPDQIVSNLADVQLRNGLAPATVLTSTDFTVEMETGTGKTYVYLRTIFELNRRFGFTKFIIVVPSVAIKEGVHKTLEMTEDHLRVLYANPTFEHFLYDSTKLGQVRNFATSPHIQIMVVTVGAINKKEVNNLYKETEKVSGERPIDLIRATRPIVIVDEPQSVDGGLEGSGKKALDEMAPLCALRYSATHVDKHHMVYRLDAVDAYQRKLVKQIEVASGAVTDAHNRPYIRLLSVHSKRGAVTATVEVDRQRVHGIVREPCVVHAGDDLLQTTGRAVYAGYVIDEIAAVRGGERIELRGPGVQTTLRIDQIHGGADQETIKRQMIRRTIKEHLDKERRLRPRGIKVLSLFFVDAVEHYRRYDADGNAVRGKYAEMFEEEYAALIKHADYNDLYKSVDTVTAAAAAHDGYFSIDKNKRWTDTAEKNEAGRVGAERAYNLIMKDKERLLSFDTQLKFIFSHSALRDGWDNPNVFQICTLREIGSERERRQTIGRGLRICVNQEGQRVRDAGVNTLTVIATESYEKFAEALQAEIERDTGIRFGVVEKDQFAILLVDGEGGVRAPLGTDRSTEIWTWLRAQRFISAQGKVLDSLRAALRDGSFALPSPFEAQTPQVGALLRKLAGKLEIKNADDRRPVATRGAVLESAEFRALWDRIKHKTTYRVAFDNERLIRECVRMISELPPVARARFTWRKADLQIEVSGVHASARGDGVVATTAFNERDIDLPDILTELQDRTQLTRRTLVTILRESGRLDDFRRNPQQFLDLTAEAITVTKRMALVDGIKYQRLGDEACYAQELFQAQELAGYLKENMVASSKSPYEYVVYDSGGIERDFADALENNVAVKVYAKLPGWFTVPTPLGSYHPDWAVLVEQDGAERLYFVVETKGSMVAADRRGKEGARIKCGKAHFASLVVRDGTSARSLVARDHEDFERHL